MPISWLNTQHRPGLRRRQRVRLGLRLGDGVHGEGLPHREAGRLPARRGATSRAPYRLLQMISHREGFGDLLAEGVKRASEKIGGEAAECADLHHEGRLSARPRSPGALGGDARHLHVVQRHHGEREPDVPDRGGPARPHQSLRRRAGGAGWSAASSGGGTSRTRWAAASSPSARASRTWPARSRPRPAGTITLEDAMRFGRRTAAILRAFNLRCGIGTDVEYPSARYGSQPVDGPAKDHDVMEQWERMLDVWYETVGYDRKTGKPTRETLKTLGLDWLAKDLWKARSAGCRRAAAAGEPSACRSHHVGDEARGRRRHRQQALRRGHRAGGHPAHGPAPLLRALPRARRGALEPGPLRARRAHRGRWSTTPCWASRTSSTPR